MKCPTCPDTALVLSDRQGIEIDYCPQCRGVWLDRGELDKLIERSVAAAPAAPAAVGSHAARSPRDFVDSDHSHGRGHYGSRKKSWLSDIFD
ncbi:MAG: zf-TFIIB domain-containing protein [Rubrivivax sp.]|nr:zf-TFIIB domain-containing protein [Rubrivivax sp.]